MPRKARRTQSGAPAGGAVMPVDSTYGEGEAALEAQRRMPVPDFAKGGGSAIPVAPSGGSPAPGGGGSAAPMDMALAAAQGMQMPPSVSAPTSRPLENLQTGLGTQGQRVLPNESLFELRAIAQRFPYPDLLRMIERIEREG